jgi:hypothetical protein
MIIQQRLLAASELKMLKDEANSFPSLDLLKLMKENKTPRRARLLVLLTAFKIFYSEEDGEARAIAEQLNLIVYKDMVFLNRIESSENDDLSPMTVTRLEQAFRKLD